MTSGNRLDTDEREHLGILPRASARCSVGTGTPPTGMMRMVEVGGAGGAPPRIADRTVGRRMFRVELRPTR